MSTYRERSSWGAWHEVADLLPASYTDAIDAAGGVAMLLPGSIRQNPGAVDSALAGVHGLLLSGGPDIDPACYGADRDERTGPARAARDWWEIDLARAAIRRGMPVLGVCRGMQVLNVALGGTLFQHLPDQVGHDGHSAEIGVHGRHDITTAAGSRVASVYGPRVEVATYHHQAVRDLGVNLVATAWAEDLTIEAAELAGPDWVVGVQWHPEVQGGETLFGNFVAACSGARATDEDATDSRRSTSSPRRTATN